MGSPEPRLATAPGRAWPAPVAAVNLGRPTDGIRELIRQTRSSDAVVEAHRIAETTTDPYEKARALLMKLAALLNLGRMAECPAVVDRADEILRDHPDPALLGEFHALAGFVGYAEGSLDRGVMHLVYANRVLETVERHDVTSADAWSDLALTYSYLGFHEQARRIVVRAHQAAQAAGVHPAEHAVPDVTVRAAVALDHCGDREGCRSQLAELLESLRGLLADVGGFAALRPDHVPYVEYAAARLAVLGDPGPAAAMPQDRRPGAPALPETAQLRVLTAVCQAILDGRTGNALDRLSQVRVDPRTLGGAEVHRLRALAYSAAGDFVAADAADRAAFRIASADLERIRALFVDGIAVRIDHEELRRTVGRYAGQALSDPLTGLPNRRGLEQRADQLARDREKAVLGVVDLDAFKAVNTVHGHLTGDLVLQRVAAVLARALRRNDYVARYGGDEFVVILPSTSLGEAEIIGRRLVNAVRDEDWESIVPGTPVSASAGWAELYASTGLVNAFRTADRAMLDEKKRGGAG